MELTDNVKKTIIGIIAAIAGAAVYMGWLTPEQAGTINDSATGLLENIGGVILAIIGIFGIFTGRKNAE